VGGERLNPGTLYVVATPIGNLEDITLRALRVLRAVDLIAAEDTRTTRKLLSHYDIHTPLISYHEHSPPEREAQILEALERGDVALVSEAGTPGISDPGLRLIREAVRRGHRVVPIPGPSAVTAALAVSGLPTTPFLCLGFLPRERNERREHIAAVAQLPYTLVIFEAPHRLRASLSDLLELLGDRQVAIARELTKVHEEVWRGSLAAAVRHFEAVQPRGEFTLVIEGAAQPAPQPWTEEQVRALLAQRKAEGAHARTAVREVAELAHWPRRDVYRVWIELEEEGPTSQG
jgi:16S rRNA (cytidine1402-2'-O)-methyltransferase